MSLEMFYIVGRLMRLYSVSNHNAKHFWRLQIVLVRANTHTHTHWLIMRVCVGDVAEFRRRMEVWHCNAGMHCQRQAKATLSDKHWSVRPGTERVTALGSGHV